MNVDEFKAMQREASLYAASRITPADYQGADDKTKIANCYIALDMARRLGANPLMVMQNLFEVKGKFGWSTQFLIACFNACGRFGAIAYEQDGDKVRACAREKATGRKLEGPWVSLAMAEEAGWTRNPIWKTMPDLMLRYRAAAFLIRTTAPEIAMGFYTAQELEDIAAADAGKARPVKAEEGRPPLQGAPHKTLAPADPGPEEREEAEAGAFADMEELEAGAAEDGAEAGGWA